MTDYTKLIERLRNTPNWQRESYGDWKQGTVYYDRAPFEAADAIEALQGENELMKQQLDADKDVLRQDQKCILKAVADRDALQAKLDELQRQEPVAHLDLKKLQVGGMAYATAFKSTEKQTALYAGPNALEPVKFLADATRFKTTMLASGRVLINDLPRELAGRWVAFVAAENDCHLKLAAPKALEEQEPREQRADWLPVANALDHAVRELGRTKEANAHDWNTAVHVFEFARATTCTCCSSPLQWPAAYRCLDCKAVLCEACAPIHFGPDHSKRAAEAHEGN